MTKKLSLIFVFHVLCLGLLFVPDKYQGSVVLTMSGINLRLLDVTAVSLIILATVVMFIVILKNLLPQMKQLQELARAEENNRKKPGNGRKG